HPAVEIEIGDVANLREFEPPGSAPRRRAADLQRPEQGREIAQRLVTDVLAVEDQHAMLVDRRPQLLDRRRAGWPRQVDPANLGADMRMDGGYRDRHDDASRCSRKASVRTARPVNRRYAGSSFNG